MRGWRAAATWGAVAGAAGAACVTDPAGSWTDDFRGPPCLAERRHVRTARGGGLELDPAEQAWTIPDDAPFTAGRFAGGAVAGSGAGGKETLTLDRRILRPGAELAVGAACDPGGEARCPLDPAVRGTVTGRVHADDPGTRAPEGLAGFPGFGAAGAPGAGWGTRSGRGVVCRGAGDGARPLGGAPLLLSGPLDLRPGVAYAVSVAVSSSDDDDARPLLGAMFAADGERLAGVDLREDEVASPAAPDFTRMSPVTFGWTRPAGGPSPRLAVAAAADADPHCLLLGPAYVVAQRGEWTSEAFDTLSDRTAWRSVEWEADQSSGARDPSCGCASPGAPLTPVRVWWEAAPGTGSAPRFGAPAPLPDRGGAPVPAESAGRYFRFAVTLHGRDTAGEAEPSLAPRVAAARFAGWTPVVRRLRVRYRAAAARAESRLVAPPDLGRWISAGWEGEAPGGTDLSVDVLAEDGTPVVERAGRATDLAAVVDPFEHPALRLRARLASDPADPAAAATLRRWGLRWEPMRGRVLLDRDILRPGERLRGLAVNEREGRVRVRVHDATGRIVARPLDEWRPARAVRFGWDGRTEGGEAAPAGTYRITVTTPKGAGTRVVRVTA